jgi:murein DD-endopeptidase MepM/ murein hydrolase activator NlpD
MNNDVTSQRPSRLSLSVPLSGLFLVGVMSLSGASSPIEPAGAASAAVNAPGSTASTLSGGAQVVSHAERIVATSSGLRFPMEPTPRCIVGNNFGAMSKLYGTGRHEGVDISGTLGQHVFAVVDGVLSRQFTNDGAAGFGWELRPVGGDVRYRYFHLSGFADGLTTGVTVTAGQLIGYVGDTGNPGAGNHHLHFEVRPANVPVDPVPLLAIPTTCQVLPRP